MLSRQNGHILSIFLLEAVLLDAALPEAGRIAENVGAIILVLNDTGDMLHAFARYLRHRVARLASLITTPLKIVEELRLGPLAGLKKRNVKQKKKSQHNQMKSNCANT